MTSQARPLLRAPIFLHCMSRGGSNILWNLFLTHPDVCSPILETLEIFRTSWRAPTAAGLRLALTSGQPRFFDQWHLEDRRPLPRGSQLYLDRVLHRNMMRTVDDDEMRFKNADEVYSREEVASARLVAKNNNGLIFLGGALREIYPDATFFCLVRHPEALYESHKRRRLWRSPAEFARFYNRITGKMLSDVEQSDRSSLVRFEDILSDPIATLHEIYAAAGLDTDRVRQVRLRSKEHFQANGSRGTDWKAGRHRWLDFDEVRRVLDPNINRLHAERLEPAESREVLDLTAAVRERLGYGAGDAD